MPFYTKNKDLKTSDHSQDQSIDSKLRFGQISDLEKIQKLHEPFVKQGVLLYKDLKKIEHDLPQTIVYCVDHEILGAANLYRYDANLFEIRGLAISESHQRHGIGKRIVEKLIQFLKKEYPNKKITVFALTMTPDFFIKMGWNPVKKENFPKKIFDDCAYCTKKDDCFEEAVEIILNGDQ
ncbi:MAG: GNAT family N-acetyltransferase [Spirochaetia bacterium]|nr:GNAT family N-acetyltransferase [Spirochaetia bacterium]